MSDRAERTFELLRYSLGGDRPSQTTHHTRSPTQIMGPDELNVQSISISLSLGWRQRRCRYAIRAGRNLPDKEFRYLRTVIVTAAVYWGFDQELRLAADPIN
ncbi:hypothetical protein G6F46_012993 [Rhizopus delemar]|nr:hypothetical protein G6F46_012993 [Rhizopus delemar]